MNDKKKLIIIISLVVILSFLIVLLLKDQQNKQKNIADNTTVLESSTTLETETTTEETTTIEKTTEETTTTTSKTTKKKTTEKSTTTTERIIHEKAVLLNSSSNILINNKKNSEYEKKLLDTNYTTYLTMNKNTELTITSKEAIDSLFLLYEIKGYKTTLSYNNLTQQTGKNGFMHEFVQLKEETNKIKLTFNEKAVISDIYIFTNGKLPNYVQKWNATLSKSDLLLFSTHGDDEHLMFAGLIPTYVARGYKVQVAYLIHHKNKQIRYHEQLYGLWEAGIKNYPIFGAFPDQYSYGLEKATENLASINLTQDDIIKWQAEVIRRTKPEVVAGHAENGDYGHGQHIINSLCLEKAVDRAEEADFNTKNYNTPWTVKKTYIHLLETKPIVLDIDKPLSYFNGKTAFQVSQLAFKHHKSQMTGGWVYEWLCGKNNEITSSTQLTKLFPNRFGLYKTTVGDDLNKNDMFENIK